MRAVGYIRVSTEEQVREGYSLSAQEQAIRSYCQAQQWDLVSVFSDAGKSGSTIKHRDALQQLLSAAGEQCFDRVVFMRLDRLGRNLKDLLAICDHLQTNGAEIVSIQEAIDTGTPAGRLSRSVLGAAAEFERDVIRERIKVGLAEMARQGKLIGSLPIGYRRNAAGDVELDQEVAPRLSEMFDLYAAGGSSLRDMTRWAESAGLRSTRGNLLDRLSIRKILRNSVYSGKVMHGRKTGGGIAAVEGLHPALVSQDTFDRVQTKLTNRRYSYTPTRPWGRNPYPLSGIAVCAHDGAQLLGVRAGSQGRRYMRCSTAQRRGRQACCQPMVQADLLEAQIAAYLTGMSLPDQCVDNVISTLRTRVVGSPIRASNDLNRELERWKRLFVLGEVNEQEFLRESRRLHDKLAALEQPEALDLKRAADILRDVGALWTSSPATLQREFVHETFTQVTVKGPQVMAITPKPLYAPLFMIDREERFYGQLGVVWLPEQDSNLQPAG